MFRLALVIIFAATLLGALMPFGGPERSESQREGPLKVQVLGSANGRESSDDWDSNAVLLQRQLDGHFYADVQVNGAQIHFLVDTGASGIALSADDARRAGLAFNSGEAEVIGSGASGAVMGHHVQLNRVELGTKSVSDAAAVVLEGGDRSLLGQSFLSKFGSVEIRGDTMVLR